MTTPPYSELHGMQMATSKAINTILEGTRNHIISRIRSIPGVQFGSRLMAPGVLDEMLQQDLDMTYDGEIDYVFTLRNDKLGSGAIRFRGAYLKWIRVCLDSWDMEMRHEDFLKEDDQEYMPGPSIHLEFSVVKYDQKYRTKYRTIKINARTIESAFQRAETQINRITKL